MNARFTIRAMLSALALAATITAPARAAGEPACTQWNLSQGWYARQTNQIDAKFLLQQRGTRVSGTGSFSTPRGD